jgi:alpha-galactosidase
MRRLLALAALLFSTAGCGSDDTAPSDAGIDADAADAADGGAPDAPVDPPLNLPAPGSLVVTTHDDGRVDVGDDEGTVYVRGAWAEALYREGEDEATLSTRGCAGTWEALAEPFDDASRFADGTGHTLRCDGGDGLALVWRLWVDRAHDALLADVAIESAAGSPERTALRLTPLLTEGDEGGLFVGGDIDRHRVLDNGADLFRETEAFLHYPRERRSPVLPALPIEVRGNIVANWNHAIADLDGHRHFVAGALGVERSLPTLGVAVVGDGPLDEPTGRRGFSAFYADFPLMFAGKPLHPGDAIRSETLYVDPLSSDPLGALESFADAVAASLDVEIWTERDGGRRIPNGWNSWTGSGSTGGLGTDIDQTLMRECLEVMAREFEPFGIDYFQIDDGYQDAYGDWNASPTRFPDGIDDLSSRIQATGLEPGIWIQAFIVEDGSQLAMDHPDWLHSPDDAALDGALVPDEGTSVLDLSNDEVNTWLGDLMRRYRDDWGMRWLKLDFAYLALPYQPRADPDLTSVEAYRRGLTTIRDALGRDVFYLGIGLVGMNYGVVDGMRLTLDDGPIWEDDTTPIALFSDAGTLKSTVRTGSRRYYLHDRVFIAHNDLLFFRTAPDAPTLTLEEATTFASFIGLSGSIVKLGEDLRTLTPEQIQVVRKVLPTYPGESRPLDLFTRHYPEVWRLDVDGTMEGSDTAWTVLGLLNWGRNFDWNTDLGAREMPDEARTYTVALADLGLDPSADYLAHEFWSETFLGVVSGDFTHEVGAHGHAVVALRPVLGHPQLLGTNRHFTQGATDLVEETWDEASRTLALTFRVDAGSAEAVPFEYRVRVYAPTGYAVDAAASTGGEVTQDGEVVTVRFTPAAPGEQLLSLVFTDGT